METPGTQRQGPSILLRGTSSCSLPGAQSALPGLVNRVVQYYQNTGQGNLKRVTEYPVAGQVRNSIPGAQNPFPFKDKYAAPQPLGRKGFRTAVYKSELAAERHGDGPELHPGCQESLSHPVQVPSTLPLVSHARSHESGKGGYSKTRTKYPVAGYVQFSLPSAESALPGQDNHPAQNYQNAGQGNVKRNIEYPVAGAGAVRASHLFTGCFQGMVERDEHFATSQPSRSRSILAVAQASVDCLGDAWIAFPPTRAAEAATKAAFARLDDRFDSCIGCVDGTLIAVQAPFSNNPDVNKAAYFCRKEFLCVEWNSGTSFEALDYI
ncbi:hypothetical protein HPB48_022416 [Haemaphysalis longicornis]|uniref:Uncharacterized protein n=1 Tax=Haemaphysalis longicornis TaxID=44386 RepID=A0A9J6G868_HAELO|nr:hypothetical protein HPB48_022416 [Haemaphysalis longicornis]